MGLPATQHHTHHDPAPNNDSFILRLYEQHHPMINALATRFHMYRLDPSLQQEDFLQEAYLATIEAAAKWDFRRGNAKFGSLLYLYLKKRFQKLIGGRNRLIEITTREGIVLDVIPYTSWLKKARMYEAQGLTGHPINRIIPLDTVHPFTIDHVDHDCPLTDNPIPHSLITEQETHYA